MGRQEHAVRVLASVHKLGPRLIEMDADVGASLAGQEIDGALRLVPEVHYRTLSVTAEDRAPTKQAHTGFSLSDLMDVTVTVTNQATGAPVSGAKVALYLDFAAGKGMLGHTGDDGRVSLKWLKSLPVFEQVWVWPPDPPTLSGAFRTNVAQSGTLEFAISPVDPAYQDAVSYYFPDRSFDASTGVRVGIIDTGVASDTALNLTGGLNCVENQDPTEYGSVAGPHGTHVAGLVGSSGTMQGLAPGVDLRSYRVFAEPGAEASNFAILKAVNAGVEDGCDILNMSLGVDGTDPALQSAVTHARDNGVLVIAASNNNSGGAVGSPSAYPDCIGVSAMGRVGTIPDGARATADISDVRGTDPDCFLASFASIGPQLDCIAPGVGIISTVPGNQWGQMSGSSMACPVISGVAAAILSKDNALLKADRNRARSDALAQALGKAAVSMGFAEDQQGQGCPKIGSA